ncbi:MAG: preprotein translocase subunit SecE [Oscillospiraceae bacterium]
MAEEKKSTAPAKSERAAVKKVDNPKKLSFFQRVEKWFRELKSELKKVVWPAPAQVWNNTLVVLVVMAVSSLVIWGFDHIAQNGVQALITLVG